jgi:hypothetical protein
MNIERCQRHQMFIENTCSCGFDPVGAAYLVGYMPDSGNIGSAGSASIFCLKALILGTDFVLTRIYVE